MAHGRVYLSGGMQYYPAAEKQFTEIARILRADYAMDVYNPTEVEWGQNRYSALNSEGFRNNIADLTAANTLFVFGQWKQARGCIAEVMLATLFGCAIFELDEKALLAGELVLNPIDVTRDNLNGQIVCLLETQAEMFSL